MKRAIGLSTKDWRYCVIAGVPDEMMNPIELAGILFGRSVELGFSIRETIISAKEWHRYFRWKGFESLSFWESAQRNKIAPVTADEIASEEPKALVEALQALGPKDRAIVAAGRLQELNGLPRHSDMQILGLFAIIESLVTHQQKDRDLHDSLNHQIGTKVPLLLKRSFRHIEALNYFAFPQSKSLWKSLYSLRSKIAHGGTVEFRTGEFQPLGSSSSVAAYVREVTKQLIRLQIADPIFMEDLRAV